MKCNAKLIIIIILLIISIFFLGKILLDNYSTYKFNKSLRETHIVSYTGIIKSIENNTIVMESSNLKKFTFSKEGVTIQDNNGNINMQLNVGDTIEVINNERKVKMSFDYVIEPLENVQLIKILSTN